MFNPLDFASARTLTLRISPKSGECSQITPSVSWRETIWMFSRLRRGSGRSLESLAKLFALKRMAIRAATYLT